MRSRPADRPARRRVTGWSWSGSGASPSPRPCCASAHGPWTFNLLDTPGHADFSEDTYRTLWAADAAVVVIDRARGIETQTRKLYRVCRSRGVPVITFINKCDRPGRAPLELMDEIEAEFQIRPVPLTWPVGDGIVYSGIVDRADGSSSRSSAPRTAPARARNRSRPSRRVRQPGCPPGDWQETLDELELLDHAGDTLDQDAVLGGRQTPVFFGSALTNLGVQRLLEGFAAGRTSPTGRRQLPGRRGRDPSTHRSPASCSRSRPTPTPGIETGSPSCASRAAGSDGA